MLAYYLFIYLKKNRCIYFIYLFPNTDLEMHFGYDIRKKIHSPGNVYQCLAII